MKRLLLVLVAAQLVLVSAAASSAVQTARYPWKTGIRTTLFWMGPGAGLSSSPYSWPSDATRNPGNRLNPFYVALPFNDLAYPDLARKWLPAVWQLPTQPGAKPASACQGRWVEVRNSAGLCCFAQWEDVGPIVTDDAAYVFGVQRSFKSRGLDVSPTVAKDLGMDNLSVTSWRFVDDHDVPEGPWLDDSLIAAKSRYQAPARFRLITSKPATETPARRPAPAA